MDRQNSRKRKLGGSSTNRKTQGNKRRPPKRKQTIKNSYTTPLKSKALTSARSKSRFSKQATLKPRACGVKYASFSDIKTVGWINEPIDLGILQQIHDGKGRVTFEFKQSKKIFDATVNKNPAHEKYIKLLKTGHSYVLTGSIRANTLSRNKYNRSSNSTAAFTLSLFSFDIVEDVLEAHCSSVVERSTLKQLSTQVASSGKSFIGHVKNVTICGGEMYRYMGCGVCSSSIRHVDLKDGKFYCKLCKKKYGSKRRAVCIVMRHLQLKDDHGTLHGVTLYNEQCNTLLGENVAKSVREAPTDILARQVAERIIGTVVDVTIKHQLPTKAQRQINEKSRLIGQIQKVIHLTLTEVLADDVDEDTSNDSAQQTKNRESGVDCCNCEDENDDDSVDEHNENLNPEEGVNEAQEDGVSGNDLFILDTMRSDSEEVYQLTSNPSGLALIINISKENDPENPERRGSNRDVRALQSLLPRLDVKIFENLANINRKELAEAIERFQRKLVDDDISFCCFVFMGHGTLNTVKLVDNQRVDIFTEILNKFTDSTFEEFAHKPKIFIFQACQNTPRGLSNASEGLDAREDLIPSNVIYFTPCQPGVKAKRNPKKGSYFIQTFCKILRKHAASKDLESMAKLTQVALRDTEIGEEGNLRNILPLREQQRSVYPKYD